MYATMGGQVNDEGQIANEEMTAEVISVDKDNAGKYLHTAEITKGTIRKGDKVTVRVDKAKRMATCRNHTSTHILQAALREVLGDHVQQKGSYVDSERLRFDFTHFNAMTKEEISKVEEIVNEKILEDLEVSTRVMKQKEARELGAMAFFDDKYGEEVRVVTIGDIDDPFSIEFCGGTHMKHSSQAGQFRIVSEQGIASGIRRIEAVTGKACYEQNREDRGRIEELAGTLKVNKDQLVKKSENLIAEVKSLEKEIAQIQKAAAGSAADDLIKNASEIGGVTAVIAKTDAQDAASLRDMADSIKDRLESGFVFLASDAGDKVLFVSMATKDAVSKGAHAGNVIKEAARIAGGGGGGRPDMAQAGGKDKSKIDEALSKAKEIVTAQLGG